jgi:replicative DNA helicase
MYAANPDSLFHVQNLVRPDIFTTLTTKEAYKIITEYHQKNIKLDGAILFRLLIKAGVPQANCTDVAAFSETPYLSQEQLIEYVTILFNDYVKRYLTSFFERTIISLAKNDPISEMMRVKDVITQVELAVNNVSKDKSIKVMFDETVQRIKDLKTGTIERYGFSWGLPSLDKKTLGIVQGINVVAADKGGGKSSLLINIIVENAIVNPIPLLFFSMEMTAIEVLTNVIANMRRINSRALRTGGVDDEQLLSIEQIKNRLHESFTIDETGGITWAYFEAKVRAHRKKHKIPPSQTMLVLLDYLGLMKNMPEESRMSKEEKVEQTCTELMRICKNENIALVKLAQFSREGSKRGNDTFNIKTEEDKLRAMRPRMTDLKGSSAIESNAVSIILLYRAEYYGITEVNGKSLIGLCEINIAKGRYVEPKPVYVNFQGKYNLFTDIEEGLGAEKEDDPF